MPRFVSGEMKQAILVPVPLHRSRIWTRGYDQSALIAPSISRRTGVRILLDGMRRTNPHPAAQRNDIRQSGDEVRGAFSISRKADIQGKRIILIDDVLTTGSIADACAKALLKVGAADVEPICFARVVRPAPFTR